MPTGGAGAKCPSIHFAGRPIPISRSVRGKGLGRRASIRDGSQVPLAPVLTGLTRLTLRATPTPSRRSQYLGAQHRGSLKGEIVLVGRSAGRPSRRGRRRQPTCVTAVSREERHAVASCPFRFVHRAVGLSEEDVG